MRMRRIKRIIFALSFSLSQIIISNRSGAIFKNHQITYKYCPYEQADHLVDGLWWFYDRNTGNAFFILSRVFKNEKLEFINKSKFLEDLKRKHFTVIHKDELIKNYNQNGEHSFDGYLYRSFMDAGKTIGNDPCKEYQDLVKDNPLDHLADYYDGDEYFFWRRIFSRKLNEQGPAVEPKSKVITHWGNSGRHHPFLSEFSHLNLPYFNAEERTKSLVLSHGSIARRDQLSHLSSLDTLRQLGIQPSSRTENLDARLKNTGFVFTTLCPSKSDFAMWNTGSYIRPSPTRLFFKNIEKLPIVVVSLDQIYTCGSCGNKRSGNVWICGGKDCSAIWAYKYLKSTTYWNPNYSEKCPKEYFGKKFEKWLEDFGVCYPYECRIPTYLIPKNEDFYVEK